MCANVHLKRFWKHKILCTKNHNLWRSVLSTNIIWHKKLAQADLLIENQQEYTNRAKNWVPLRNLSKAIVIIYADHTQTDNAIGSFSKHTPSYEYSKPNQFNWKRCINSHKAILLNKKKRKAKRFSPYILITQWLKKCAPRGYLVIFSCGLAW